MYKLNFKDFQDIAHFKKKGPKINENEKSYGWCHRDCYGTFYDSKGDDVVKIDPRHESKEPFPQKVALLIDIDKNRF